MRHSQISPRGFNGTNSLGYGFTEIQRQCWLWANYTNDRMSGLEQRELSPGEKPFSPIPWRLLRTLGDSIPENGHGSVFLRQHIVWS